MSSTLIYQYLNETSVTVTVPPGYSSNVAVYAWGAGGANGTGAGGAAGGFVSGNIVVTSGDVITVSVGGGGTSASGQIGGRGGKGNNPIINLDGGAGANQSDPEDGDAGASGGGGAASAVFINNIPMLVAAGGGGGGGYGDDGTGGATAGTAGGVATKLNTSPRGENGKTSGGGGSGGGGAGYPYGGATGTVYGDDASGSGGGYGGQNYANATVLLSTTVSGSGVTPGGASSPYYPGSKRGHVGYGGAVILVFTKNFTSWIKDSGLWKQVNSAFIKTPTKSITTYITPPGSANYSSVGTSSFVVPPGVFSLNVSSTGGGGGGQTGWGNYSGAGGGGAGGGAGNTVNTTISVTPGQILNIVVGAGGLGGAGSYAGGTSPQGPAGLDGGASYITGYSATNAAGGAGGYKGSSGTYSNSIGNWAGNGGSWWYGFAGANSAIGGGGGRGEVNTNGGRGGPGAGGGGGAASNYNPNDSQTAGGNGGTGQLIITYSSTPVPIVTSTGGWKEILKGWVKQSGSWKLIETSTNLVPASLRSVPIGYTTINIVISTDTNNYNLIDFLPGYGYNPGQSLINLIVDNGVTVGSVAAGTPSLSITGMTAGDVVNLINNGSIVGAGGRGGAAGSYTSVTTGGTPVTSTSSCFLPGTLVSTPDGYIPIETIQVGDTVYAYNIGPDFNNSIALEPKTVTKTYKHTWEEANQITPLLIITHSQGELIVTPEHELLCLDKVDPNSDYPGFVRADALAIGDIIYSEDGSELTVTNISDGPEHYEYVYNIEVDDYHTYVANSVRVHNGVTTPAPVGNYTIATTTIYSNPGKPGEKGGIALYTTHNITLANNGIIAGGGGGGGGGGGPTGGQGGGGAGSLAGSGANNGTLIAGGAGAGLGGAGGSQGTAGSNGTNQTNAGGVGGPAGPAIVGIDRVSVNVEGTIIGPRNIISAGPLHI